ncbi:PKD domain-containing protein [Flavobacterium sp. PLA-1-15]|uniref:PKD domain-containing protein n=1 Tax=Flavobacterium sp. PLA-1-15 TaxID=3380533 RepID=UPI003B7A1CC2
MKKTTTLLLAFVIFGITSCSPDKLIESATDCLFESALVLIDHTKATEDPKKVTFEITYGGEKNLDENIKWDFGDGTPVQTLTGTTATHTYTTAGSYTAKAVVTLNGGKCSYDKHNTVDIE